MEEKRRLNELPNELILMIFSFLPMFKETVATHLISKFWEEPWELEPDVMLDDDDESYESFRSFVYESLLSNDAQILDRLHLKLSRIDSASHINFWVKSAVYRSVRKLRIHLFGKTLELPSCLSGSACVTLKSLILREVRIEVVPPWFRLPSLKSLHLLSVTFSDNESASSLLQICPDLEYLVLHQTKVFGSNVPALSTYKTLKSLTLRDVSINDVPSWLRLPSLKALHLLSVDFSGYKSNARLLELCPVARLLGICPVVEDLVVKRTEVFHSKVPALSTWRTLKTLILREVCIKEVSPWFRLPSLKSLHLLWVKSSDDEAVASLLQSCPVLESLVVNQEMHKNVLFKVVPPWFCLPSLKSLHLLSVNFSGDDSVEMFLKCFGALEDLVVSTTKNDNVMIFNINVPTLKSLSIDNSKGRRDYVKKIHGFVINAPALRKFDFKDTFSNFLTFGYMPEVIKANIQVICDQSEKFIGSLTSVQHLSLCSLTSEAPYPRGTFFFFLEHLELCTCSARWWSLLACILKDAPRLRSLKLKSCSQENSSRIRVKMEEKRRLSELPDDLILIIFSFLPMFKETTATHLISKCWEETWELEPDVMLDDDDESYESFMSFVYGSLLSNDAQILERLHLKLGREDSASHINLLVKNAVIRSVRKLRIHMSGQTLKLPSCLSSCVTLKSLILREVRIELIPPWFRLPSLKSLHLLSVTFWGNPASLLQICPGLEYLVLHQTQVFGTSLPALSTYRTLKSLTLREVSINDVPSWLRFPSLKVLHLLSVEFPGYKSNASLLEFCPVARLIRICPVLEDLVVNRTEFSSKVPALSTWRTLKTLILREVCIQEVSPWFRLPTLKSLQLLWVKSSDDEAVASLLQSCPVLESLVVDQEFNNNVTFKVLPPWFCLPSLKSVHLLSVNFSGDDSVESFLKCCGALEDLVVSKTKDDNVMIFNINVPTLKSLSIDNSKGRRDYVKKIHGFVINAPSLEKLNFKDTFSNFLTFEYMPEVIKANIEVICDQSEKFIGSLTSIQHLSLCSLTSKTPYPRGTLFFFLEHLELCTCSAGWSNLLSCILKAAPTIRSLKLKSKHSDSYWKNPWDKPTDVPECLSKHLELLEWRKYEGTEKEMEVAAYILANATCLKRATFSSRYHGMLREKELKKMNRVSETCHDLISKRWRGLSKLVTDLTIDDASDRFVVYAYLLNNAQTLDRLQIKLLRYYHLASDINAWVQAAVDRSVREVRIHLSGHALELPSCLTTCKTLNTLILHEVRIKVVPHWFRLPSLKTLHLLSVEFYDGGSVASLVRICPVLEVLVVDQTRYDSVMVYNIIVPSLRSLSIGDSKGKQNMETSSINKLPDELLLKILSSLSTKQSIETSFLSKRWRGLWRLVPHLTFDDELYSIFFTFTRFVYTSLLFNKCQVLERLDLKSCLNCCWDFALSINDWLQAAVNRSVRELRIDLFGRTLKLPSCITLKSLILREVSIEVVTPEFRLPSLKTLHLLSVKFSGDETLASFLQSCPVLEYLVVIQTKDDDVMFKVVPPWFCLPSLKSLHLLSVKFSGDESLASLLQNCLVLEDLVVNKIKDDNVKIFNINVPTLKSLCIDNSEWKRSYVEEIHGFVINAPALRKFYVKDTFSNFLTFGYMPEVITANIEVICDQSEKFIGSFTSVQHLSLCSLTSEAPYPRGTFFFFLEHLELCTCSAGWWSLLACILKVAPRLRSLKLKSNHRSDYNDPMICLSKPSVAPVCLSTHLEIFEWRQYEGKEQERKVAAYILANSTFLKMATFSSRCRNKHHSMFRKLKSMDRVSKTCQLVID
ncbi:unnamed protein product [Microthlaspi erraticum]|uniref:F-box domain-containing protein n=1 Tax=Microthlaspi erraticum TaxID=1685480 RepID=A0A6D2LCZ3_9BRAS|nr:unnamed protein product [Microthlaspi erraticum]